MNAFSNQEYHAHCERQAFASTCLADLFPGPLTQVIDRLAFGEPPLRVVGCHIMEGSLGSVELITRDGKLAVLKLFSVPFDALRCVDIYTGLVLWECNLPGRVDLSARFLELENRNFGSLDEEHMLCQFARQTGELSRSHATPRSSSVRKTALFATVTGGSWIAIWLASKNKLGTPCVIKPLESEAQGHHIVTFSNSIRTLGFDYFGIGREFFRIELEGAAPVTIVGGGSGKTRHFLDERTYVEIQDSTRCLRVFERTNEADCRFVPTRSVILDLELKTLSSITIENIFLERDPETITVVWDDGTLRISDQKQTAASQKLGCDVVEVGDRLFCFDSNTAFVDELSSNERVKLPQGHFLVKCFSRTAVLEYPKEFRGKFNAKFVFLK